ncbi:MAG: prephenate dehydrogenase/arogenate dehydrogenase family protein [Eggerthellaceae bacterium]|nr:prephenate dehydrogenase/arogenate dehydrogenase family protein [Eggerthellaceae bacterium]
MNSRKRCWEDSVFKNIVIVGMGLIGASIAGAVREAWPEVRLTGIDIDERTRKLAVEKGLVDEAYGDEAFAHVLEGACDLVILATPVDADEPYLQTIADSGYEGIVTDTASTKERVTAMAAATLRYPQNFVPGHPMSGSEVNGIDGARNDLFQGAYWILCPSEDTPPDHIPALHELITGIGARAIIIAPDQHDRAVAVVSHVPHFVASSLVTLAARAADEQQTVMRLAAGGFKDTTRIAAGSPDLWCGIAFDNAEQVKAGLSDMRDILGAFADALEAGDREQLTKLLKDAADVRRSLPAAWVPSSERLLEVRIPISNHPGAVAETTTIASEVGCNIQSIEIDHVTEDRAFLSMILTDEGDIGQLSSKLIGAGYAVSFAPLEPKEHIHV